MFWKCVDSLRFSNFSLATQLLLLYTLSTIGLLLAIFFFLYPTFNQFIAEIHGDKAALILATCYRNIIVALLLSSLSALVLGRLIAKRGLRRLDDFSKKMETITADSLHERISLNDWPEELKKPGTNFNIMLDRLETSFSKISQFSSDISHELRHSLHYLIGTTERALAKENLPKEYTTLLESYMDEYYDLSKLVDHLLFLARSENGQIKLNRQSIHASTEVFKFFEFYNALTDEKQITMRCNGQASCFADLTLFKRLLNNLLSNAVHHTPQKGIITVTLQALDNQKIALSIQNTGSEI